MNQLHKFFLLFAITVCPLLFSPPCHAEKPITFEDVLRQHEETKRSRKEVTKEFTEYAVEKKAYDSEEEIEDAEEKAREETRKKVEAEFEKKLEAERKKTRELQEEIGRHEEAKKLREAERLRRAPVESPEKPAEEPEEAVPPTPPVEPKEEPVEHIEEPAEEPTEEPAAIPTPSSLRQGYGGQAATSVPPGGVSFGVRPGEAPALDPKLLKDSEKEQLGVTEPSEPGEPAEAARPTEPETDEAVESEEVTPSSYQTPTTDYPTGVPVTPVAPIVSPGVTPTITEPMVSEIQKQLNEIKAQIPTTAKTLQALTSLASQITTQLYVSDFTQLVVAKIGLISEVNRKKAPLKVLLATLLAACKANKLIFKDKEIKTLYAEHGPFNFATKIKAATTRLKKTKTPADALKLTIASLAEMLPDMTTGNTTPKNAKKFVAALLKVFKNYGSTLKIKAEFMKLFEAAKAHPVVGALTIKYLSTYVAQLNVNVVFTPDFAVIKNMKIKPWPGAATTKLTATDALLEKLKRITTEKEALTTRQAKQIYLILIGKKSVYKAAGKLLPAPNLYKQLAHLINKARAFEQIKALGTKYVKRLEAIAKQLAKGILVQAELNALKEKNVTVNTKLTTLTKLISNPQFINTKNDAIRFINALKALSGKLVTQFKKAANPNLKREFEKLATSAKQHTLIKGIKKREKAIDQAVAKLSAGAMKAKLTAAKKLGNAERISKLKLLIAEVKTADDAKLLVTAITSLGKKLKKLKTLPSTLKTSFKALVTQAKANTLLKKHSKKLTNAVTGLSTGAQKKLEEAQKKIKTIEGKLRKLETTLKTKQGTVNKLEATPNKSKYKKAYKWVNTTYQKDKSKLESEKTKWEQQVTAAEKDLGIS